MAPHGLYDNCCYLIGQFNYRSTQSLLKRYKVLLRWLFPYPRYVYDTSLIATHIRKCLVPHLLVQWSGAA